jgi:hypothetical protein
MGTSVQPQPKETIAGIAGLVGIQQLKISLIQNTERESCYAFLYLVA